MVVRLAQTIQKIRIRPGWCIADMTTTGMTEVAPHYHQLLAFLPCLQHCSTKIYRIFRTAVSFGDEAFKTLVRCPQNGTAVLNRLSGTLTVLNNIYSLSYEVVAVLTFTAKQRNPWSRKVLEPY